MINYRLPHAIFLFFYLPIIVYVVFAICNATYIPWHFTGEAIVLFGLFELVALIAPVVSYIVKEKR